MRKMIEKTISKLREAVIEFSKAENPLIITDTDMDGFTTAFILRSYLNKDIKTIIMREPITKQDIEIYWKKCYDMIFCLDFAMGYESQFETVDKSGIKKIFIQDHHQIQKQIFKSNKIELINPREEADIYINSSELMFEACNTKKDYIEDMSAIGSVNDYCIWYNRLDSMVSKYPWLFSEKFKQSVAERKITHELQNKTVLADAANLIESLGVIAGRSKIKILKDLQEKKYTLADFIEGSDDYLDKMRECNTKMRKKYEKELAKFEIECETHEKIKLKIWRHEKRLFNIINEASLKYPDYVILEIFKKSPATGANNIIKDAELIENDKEREEYIYKKVNSRNEWINYSVRNQNGRVNVGEIMHECIQGLSGKYGMMPNGGGHKEAAGASVMQQDTKLFEQRIMEKLSK